MGKLKRLKPGRQARTGRRFRKPNEPAPVRGDKGWLLILISVVMGACATALAYEWVRALVRGVHYVYQRGGPGKVYFADVDPGPYWASMTVALIVVLLLAAGAWVSVWAYSKAK